MNINKIPLPEVYTDSQDFRFFCEWFKQSLSVIKYNTENIFDLYDPLKCPAELLWLLADTMGYRYDDRLPTAFNRLVLLYFMSMIYHRGSKNGVALSAMANLTQFRIINKAKDSDDIHYNRLEDTSIPSNAVSVTPHTDKGYIDVVYFSTEKPLDACIEYTRPLGMFLFQNAGVRLDAKSKISIDARLTNESDIGISFGPTHIGHYRRDDYARLQKVKDKNTVNPSDTRHNAWDSNSRYEDISKGDGSYGSGTNPTINPGYRALHSLQLSNNEEIVKSLIPPIFSIGYGPQDVETVYDDSYSEQVESANVLANKYNLRYNRDIDESNTEIHNDTYDIYTLDADRSLTILTPRPVINPIMSKVGDAISLNESNSKYLGDNHFDPAEDTE